jgi:alkylhydroperoxidase family enzyme
MTRLPDLDAEDLPEEFRGLLDGLLAERGWVPNLYRTLAHSPVLLRDFLGITADLRHNTALEPKLRELAILGVAKVTGAPIQWLSHLPLARAAGLTEEQVTGLPVWERHPAFSEEERAVLAFAEALTREVRVPEGVWQGVRAFLGDQELVELVLTVGFYNMVARFLEGLEIDVDAEYVHGARPTEA